MQSCSIRGCESYKSIQWKPVAYFKFPFNNNDLLNSWLSQINQKNFTPTAQDQICSTHFLIEDIEPSSIGRYPILKPDAVPSVFPEGRENLEPPKVKVSTPRPDLKSLIKSATTLPQFETVLIPDYSNKGIPILPKPNVSPVKSVFPQKVLQLVHKPNMLSSTKLISSPIQIQTRGTPVQPTPVQIQPKPIQIQRIQIPSQFVKIQSPIQIQGKSFQIQKNSTLQLQQSAPLQIQQISPMQIQKSSPLQIQKNSASQIQPASPSQIQPTSPLKIPQSTPLQTQQKKKSKTKQPSVQKPLQSPTNGKLIPVKQLDLSQLQEILGNKNNANTKDVSGDNVLDKPQSGNASSAQDSRRPILKISINKINDPTKKNEIKKVVKKKPEEVLIKTLDKSVIFRLDPSGKIVVETIKNVVSPPRPSRPSPPPPPKVPVEIVQKPPKAKTQDSKLTNLKTLYNKAQEDCEKLSEKLATLKKRHQEEQEQILKLQGLLTTTTKEESDLNPKVTNAVVTRKRKVITRQEEEDEYEKLLREVRKIKEDHDKSTVTKINNKETINIKTEEISIDSEEPETDRVLTQDETINTTVSNREYQRKLKKKVTFMKKALQDKNVMKAPKIKESKIVEKKSFTNTMKTVEKNVSKNAKNDEIVGMIEDDIEFDSEDEMNFEAEYLDPEFVDC